MDNSVEAPHKEPIENQVLGTIMDHVKISIEGDGASCSQICDDRVERLKAKQQFTYQHASLQPTPFKEKHLAEKTLMVSELYKAVRSGNVDGFLDILEQASAESKLPFSAIFGQATQAGDSLLHVAAHFGSAKIAELVAYHLPELLSKRNIRGDTALHLAARAKHTNVIKIIFSQYDALKSKSSGGGDEELTRLTNECGNTALHEAVASDHLDGVAELLRRDENAAHVLNKLGMSPLYLAVLTSDMEVLSLLLQAPFPDNKPLPMCHGNSPLHAAIFKRDSARLKEILLKRSKLMHLKDEDGRTPLHYAASIGYHEGVHILSNEYYPLSALERNTKGLLPIHLACERGHVEVVKELLQHEYWPASSLNLKGQNILHVAAKNGKDNVVKYLLRYVKIEQLIVNERDNNGNTPLHLASKYLCPKVLLSLTRDKRVDVNIINNEGLTALDIVAQQSSLPILRHLFGHRKLLSHAILRSAGALQMQTQKAESVLKRPKVLPKIDCIRDRSNTLMLVAILIATVTFAAGFTVPGGLYSSDDTNQTSRGKAILVHRPLFKIFMLFNTIAMYSSIAGSFILLWGQLGDFHLAPRAFRFAFVTVRIALVTMSVAFMAAVRLVVSNDIPWLANAIFIIGISFLFFIVVAYIFLIFPLGSDRPCLRLVSNLVIWICISFSGSDDNILGKEMDRDKDKDKEEQSPQQREKMFTRTMRAVVET